MKKVCSKCGELKSLDDFYKDKNKLDGLTYECKTCSKNRMKNYKRTKEGLIIQIYFVHIKTSKRRGHCSPTYTRIELKEWLLSQKLFHELYDNWKVSGYDTNLKPSCDRTDDYKGYSLDRLQLMTWGENNRKAYSDRKSGILTKQAKAVISVHKITMKSVYYYSMMQAERETGVNSGNIHNCCSGQRNSAGNYYWKYSPTALI